MIGSITREHVNNRTIMVYNCRDLQLKFPFYVCNFYTNSSPIMLDEIQWKVNDDTTMVSLSNLFNLIRLEFPHSMLSQIEQCTLSKYTK